MKTQKKTVKNASINTLIASKIVGKVCLARCYSAGVHVGMVSSVEGENAILFNAVRLWKWSAADGIALSGVAQNGVKLAECKIDTKVPTIYLTGVAELMPCSDKSLATFYKNAN